MIDRSFTGRGRVCETGVRDHSVGYLLDFMVTIEDLAIGEGPEAKEGDRLDVHYTGMFEDGKKFDSSHDRNATFQVVLGKTGLIQGFTMGLMGMKEGGKRRVVIPPAFGYGERGAGGVIPPNATLVFEIELVKLHA